MLLAEAALPTCIRDRQVHCKLHNAKPIERTTKLAQEANEHEPEHGFRKWQIMVPEKPSAGSACLVPVPD